MGATVAPIFVMPSILFGGFFVNLNTVPGWLRWIQWTSPVRYGMEALAHIEMDEAHVSGPYDYP